MTLIDRLEAGTAEDQRGLLVEVYHFIHKEPYHRRRGPDPEWDAWAEGFNRFWAMLDCGAYLDAVLMLVPEGCLYSISALWSAGIHSDKAHRASLNHYEERDGLFWKDNHLALASTPALALAAAILKAKEVGQ